MFEKRDGSWRVVHRHTSFQAPPGPQRRVPLLTDPGPLWSPSLEGAWRDDGAILLATASFLTSVRVPGLSAAGRYRVEGERLQVTAEGAAEERTFEIESLTAATLVVRLPSGTLSFRRIE